MQTTSGCDTSLYFSIQTFPGVTILVCNDTVIIPENSVQLWAEGANSYHWIPEHWLNNANVANPIATPQETVTYTVTGANEFGCTSSIAVSIELKDEIFIPNAFLPNDDGINDVFRLGNIGYNNILEFRICNRWGETVCFTMEKDKGWDGTFKNQPSDVGTYFYHIRLSGVDKKVKRFKGDLTLVR